VEKEDEEDDDDEEEEEEEEDHSSRRNSLIASPTFFPTQRERERDRAREGREVGISSSSTPPGILFRISRV